MDPIRVGIVGVGNMGRNHARILLTLGREVEFAGVADRDPAVLASFSERFRVRSFERPADLIPLIDAAIIAVPASDHLSVALEFIRAGKHVLIEKPLAVKVEDGEALIREAGQAGVLLQVGHVERYNPAIQDLPEVLAGQPVLALESRRLSPYEGRATDVDVVLDLMIHDLDIILGLVPCPIRHMCSLGRPGKSGLIDYAVANMVFEDGCIATCIASRNTEEKVRELCITTDSSYICCDYLERKITVTRKVTLAQEGQAFQHRQRAISEKILARNVEPLLAEISDFLNCIRTGSRPAVGAESALEALRLVNRIQRGIAESAES